jgi:hypothetical protein
MLKKIKAFLESVLLTKVGNGFAFLLYYALVIVYALVSKAAFLEVASALFAGLGVQTGQRTYTQVTLTKAGCAAPPDDTGGKGDPLA